MIEIGDGCLVFRMPWSLRLASLYFGRDPAIALSDVDWVGLFPSLDVVELASIAELHWLVFSNRGLVFGFTDPRGRSTDDGGRAAVHRRPGRDCLVIKSRTPNPWSILVVSPRHAEEVMQRIRGALPGVAIREHL